MYTNMNGVLDSARKGRGFQGPLKKWEQGFNMALKKFGVKCVTQTYSGNPKHAKSSWVTFKFQPIDPKGAKISKGAQLTKSVAKR